MRTPERLSACLAAGLWLVACGPTPYPSQLVLPDGGVIPGTTCTTDRTVCWTVAPSATAAVNDGNTPTNVVVTLSQGGTAVPDGTSGSFSFSGNNSASFAVVQAGVDNTTTLQGSSANGQITFQVFDLAVETVTISMTVDVLTASTSVTLTGTQTIHFGGTCSDSFITPPSTSTSLSGIPANITLKCNDPVMGGSFAYQQSHPYDGNTQSCTAFVADINQQAVAGAAVQFLTEAGAVETDVTLPGQHPTEITDTAGEAQVSFHVQAPYPEDVPYNPTLDQDIEPAGIDTWADTGTPRWWTDSTGHTYNPRDGWVTLIAATAGKPPGGASTLVPDPYVDSDDSGQYVPGDPYIDVGCNSTYASVQKPDANGYVRIWTSTTVVWTDLPYPFTGDTADPLAVAAGVVSGEIQSLENPANCAAQINAGATCNYVFRFVDKNANLPSTMLTGNTLTPSPQGGCPMSALGGGAIDLSNSEHLLALTDFPFSMSDTAICPCAGSTYTLAIAAAFNYADPNESENSALSLGTTINYGVGVGGNCQAPGG